MITDMKIGKKKNPKYYYNQLSLKGLDLPELGTGLDPRKGDLLDYW